MKWCRNRWAGAHNDAGATGATLKKYLLRHLEELKKIPGADRLKQRYERFRATAIFWKAPAAA